MLYVSEGVNAAIRTLDPATGELTPISDFPLRPTAPLGFVAAPRSPFLVINAGSLYRFDLRTRQLRELVSGDFFHPNYAVSASGTLLAYRSAEPFARVLRIRSLDTNQDIAVLPGLSDAETIFALQWLGDSSLVFLRGEVGNRHPWRMRVDGTALEPINVPVGTQIIWMSVDPSARQMALLRFPGTEPNGPANLSIVDLVTMQERVIATLENWNYPLSWSPDSRFIAGITRRAEETTDVRVIDTRSGDARVIGTDMFEEFFVEWAVE
jgi:Tol biopolymer transport system component